MKHTYCTRLISCAAALCMVASSLSGCGDHRKQIVEQEPFTIGVVTKSRDSEYWMSVCSGMEKAALDLGVSVVILTPDTETDNEVQNKMIRDLLNKGVDALAVSPIVSYDSSAYVDEAEARGIPVYSYDTRITDREVPYIGIDNEQAGTELARYMAGTMRGRGEVGIISGSLDQTAHSDRIQGFCRYMEEHTDIRIAFIESGYSNLKMSEREISSLMKEHPNLTGIFATSAVTALGIMEYMKGRPIVIATVDAQEDALEAVRNGGIAVLAAQSGYQIGYETISYIVNDRNKAGGEQDRIIGFRILNRDNVDSFQDME